MHTNQILEEANKRNQSLQAQLHNEIKHSQSLQNKIKYLKRSNEDSEWRLQEQVAQLHSLLQREETAKVPELTSQTGTKPLTLKEKSFMKEESSMITKNIAKSNVKQNLENLELSEFNSSI